MKKYSLLLGAIAIVAIAAVAVTFGAGVDLFGASAHAHSMLATAAFGAAVSDIEIKSAFEKIGEAFDAFKQSHAEQLAEVKKGIADPLLTERLGKIEKSLDAAVETKAAIDRAIAAEKKEREDLEARINRHGIKASGEAEAKAQLELKEFNITLASLAADQKKQFVQLDEKGYGDYKSAFNAFMRKNDRMLTPDEIKTLSVGSDPDGGYFVTPDVTGRVVKKVYETSPMRQYASCSQSRPMRWRAWKTSAKPVPAMPVKRRRARTPPRRRSASGAFRCSTRHRAEGHAAAARRRRGRHRSLARRTRSATSAPFRKRRVRHRRRGKILGFAAGYSFAPTAGSGVTWGSIGYVATGVDADFAASAKGDKLYDVMGMLKNDYLRVPPGLRQASHHHRDPQVQGRPEQLPLAAFVHRRPARDHHGLPGRAHGRHADHRVGQLLAGFGNMKEALPDRRSAGHPRAARSLHRQALRQVLHDLAHRRRHGELRSAQAAEVRHTS
jgi:predicted phage gp36 major capsid-like protein